MKGYELLGQLDDQLTELDNTEHVTVMHLAEALQYRPKVVAL